MNRLEQIKKQISGPYGIQAITSHDVNWLIQELEAAIAAAPRPEPVQPDFDPIVPEHALIVGANALELAMQSGITSPRTLALVAYTDIALTLHKTKQQPAQPIPTGERFPDCKLECGAHGSYCRCRSNPPSRAW